MNISSAVGGYVHFTAVQPKPSHSGPVGQDGGRDNRTSDAPQQQSSRQTASKGTVNLLV